MGRPRKRRRESDAEEHAGPLLHVNNSHIGTSGSFTFVDFGVITPPQLHDSSLLGDSILNHDGPTPQNPLRDSDSFGISPISNVE
jgi:hypothetical protein